MDPSILRLIRRAQDAPDPASLPALPRPDRLLMAEPTFFDAVDRPAGEAPIDRFALRRQWRELLAAYQRVGLPVTALPGQPHLPSLVFCAESALPVPSGLMAAWPGFVPSIMASARRQPEVAHVAAALEAEGLVGEALNPYEVPSMQGRGDGLWHPGRALLYAGVGEGSSAAAWRRVAAMTGVPVIELRLVHPALPRLSACLGVVDERTAVLAPDAFDEEGLAVLRRCFERRVEVGLDEALRGAAGVHSAGERRCVVQAGAAVAGVLQALGLDVVEVDGSELARAGGSLARCSLPYWGV